MAKQLRGDINNDGKLSIIDMLTIFRYKSGEIELDEQELARADVNGDGSVTLIDARSILRHIAGEELIDEVIE